MSKLTITPASVLLTSGQSVTFEAVDVNGNSVPATWSLSQDFGTLKFATPPTSTTPPAPVPAGAVPAAAPSVPSTGDQPRVPRVPSATYIAPLVTSGQSVTVFALSDADSGSAIISLTPDTISIFPTKVELGPGQSQQFVAIVAGGTDPSPLSQATAPGGPATQPTSSQPSVRWIASPPVGHLSQQGLYEVPTDALDTATVNVIAASTISGKQATATVSLTSPPWTGRGVYFLTLYLFIVFSFVFLIVLLWPPALPSPETAKADRIQAEQIVENRTADLVQKETAAIAAKAKLATAKSSTDKKAQQPPTGQPAPTNDASSSTSEEAQGQLEAAAAARLRAGEALDFATKDLKKKREIEEKVNNPDVETKLVGGINRELDLLFLVLLAGSLGAFLHTSQSLSDYIGNRTLKESWAMWYYYRPFIGAGLALVFYAAIRGGVMSIATGSNAKASELNPFGIVGVSALVGMFSKAATMKLGEVFDTLFKTQTAKDSKDKLTPKDNAADSGTKDTARATGSSTK